jgi:hypothetical protein
MTVSPLVVVVTLVSGCGLSPPPAAPAPAANDDLDGHLEHGTIDDSNGLRVELAWQTQTGTTHVAEQLTLVAAGGTLDLVADEQGLVEHVPMLHEQPLPLVDHVLAAGTSRWIVLGWSSYGGGMQSEHVWLVEDGKSGPQIVDSIMWTTTRRAAGVAVDASAAPRIGVPLPNGHVDDDWQLQHGDRTLAVSELHELPAHDMKLAAIARYYTPPLHLSPAEQGWTGRFVWFQAGAHGLEAR